MHKLPTKRFSKHRIIVGGSSVDLNTFNEKQLSRELDKIITHNKKADNVKPIRTLCLNTASKEDKSRAKINKHP